MSSKKTVSVENIRPLKLDRVLSGLLNNNHIQDTHVWNVCMILSDLELADLCFFRSRNKYGIISWPLGFASTYKLRRLIKENKCDHNS